MPVTSLYEAEDATWSPLKSSRAPVPLATTSCTASPVSSSWRCPGPCHHCTTKYWGPSKDTPRVPTLWFALFCRAAGPWEKLLLKLCPPSCGLRKPLQVPGSHCNSLFVFLCLPNGSFMHFAPCCLRCFKELHAVDYSGKVSSLFRAVKNEVNLKWLLENADKTLFFTDIELAKNWCKTCFNSLQILQLFMWL